MFTPILKQLLTPVVRNIFDTYGSKMFSPVDLFTTGINGVWYDPSDLTTLYRDSAGTLPVTAVEQPVGLMLDKSGRGNHAFNSSGNSENFPVLSARYNLLTGTETLATQSVTTAATTHRLTFSGTGSITLSGTATGTYAAGTYTFTTTAGSLTLTVSGTVTKADLRANNDSLNQPPYQSVNTASDYDTVGFKPYLKFNGTNQWLQTNSIDFTYGNNMFVSAGVRKLGNTGGALCELSVDYSKNNAFAIFAPSTLKNAYGWRTRGTSTVVLDSISLQPSPTTNVVSGISNIAAPQAILRINGSQDSISTAEQGAGNYGNYPLYIGARAVSSLWFNGRLYQMVVAGKQPSAAEITSTETYINQKTGAY